MTCSYFNTKENICSIYWKWINKGLKVECSGGCLTTDGEHCSYAKAERETEVERVIFT